MPGSLSNILIHNAYIKFYTDIIGLDPKFVGIMYLIFGIWNAINDPAIGVLIDRRKYTEKRGKFLYLMRVTAPITVLSSFAMIFAQPTWGQWLIFAFFLVMLFIYDTSYTTYAISHASYVLVSAPSSKERVDVSVINTYVGNIGGLLGTLIPTLLLVGESNKRLTIILFSVVLGVNSILYFLALKPLKERKEMYQNELDDLHERKGLFSDIAMNAKHIIRSKAFLTFLLYQVIAKGPRFIYFTPFLYLMDYVLKVSGLQATLADIIPGIMLFLTVPFIGRYIKKIGYKKSIILASLPAAAGYLALYFVQNLLQAILAYIVMYVFTSAVDVAHAPLFGAIIDEDEQRTGVRKAGLYNGLNALLTIPVAGIQTAIFMAVISGFKFVAGSEVQSAMAIQGIRIGAGLIPCAFVLIGIIPMFFFPINKEKEQELSDFSVSQRRIALEEKSAE